MVLLNISINLKDVCVLHIVYLAALYLNLPTSVYLFKNNNGRTRAMCGICSKMEIKTLERRLSGVVIANFKEISCIILVFPLLILN